MGKTLYVGNLSYATTEERLRQLFGRYEEVRSAQVILDRDTGRSRGFAFVEMADDRDARAAAKGLHGKQLEGRLLTVNEAAPRDRGKRAGGPASEGKAKTGPNKARRRHAPALGRRLRRPATRPDPDKGSAGA